MRRETPDKFCSKHTGSQIAGTLQCMTLWCTNLGRVVLCRFASTRGYGIFFNCLFFFCYYFLPAKQKNAKNGKSRQFITHTPNAHGNRVECATIARSTLASLQILACTLIPFHHCSYVTNVACASAANCQLFHTELSTLLHSKYYKDVIRNTACLCGAAALRCCQFVHQRVTCRGL